VKDTSSDTVRRARRAALRIAAGYAVLASAWIVASDVLFLKQAPHETHWLASIAKGLLFVAVTALLLQVFVERSLRRAQRLSAEAQAARSQILSGLDQSLAGICIIQDDRYRYLNARYAEIFGYDSPSEIVDRVAVTDLVAPQHRALVAENVRRRLQGESTELRYEFTGVRRDGSPVELEVHGRVFTYQGRPAIIGVGLDVTERKRAARRLREAEERYRALFERSFECMFVSDLKGQFLDANQAALDLLGYTREEIPAIGFATLLAPEDLPRAFAAVESTLRTGAQPEVQEYGLRHKNGSTVFVEVRSTLIYEEGRPAALIGVARDITGRRRQQARIDHLMRIRTTLGEINRVVVHATDENALYAQICEILVRNADFRLAWIGIPDPESGMVLPLTASGGEAGMEYLRRIRVSSREDVPEGRGPTGVAIREDRIVVVNDFLGEISTSPWHDAASAAGIRSSAAIPLRRAGSLVAVWNTYAGKSGFFDAEIVGLLEEAAADVSFALETLWRNRERLIALAKAEELTRIVNLSPAVFFRWRNEPGWPAEALSGNVSVFGYTPDDFLSGRVKYADIVHPDERARVAREVEEFVASGVAEFVQEYRIRTRDGDWRWVDDRTRVVRDEDGRAARLEGLVLDITERKRAQQALAESEQRFRAMVEQSISGFYIIQDGRLAYVNARLAEIFGYASPEEIAGKSPMELVAEKDRGTVAENLRRRLAGEVEALSYSFTGLRKDGTEVEVGVHGSIASHQGRPAIMGLLQDISERKRAEEEIRRYITRLEQATQSTINVVATIGELRDPYTHGHERRVGEIAAAIAQEMGLDANRVEGIRIAGYLHDVGKIGVPAEILAKPSRLTKAEYDLVKDHAQQSYEILKTVEFPWPVAEAAWQHHERLDGSGYPRGLKGEEIILEARVLAVADVVEAMASHRPYRPGLGIARALEEIEKNRGRLYCPRVADACLRLFREKGYSLPL
jgi:PAS domain S-box-containing protein/putative nucleotidyltransferase with HDIG domain